jgi:hypothetical protein
MRVKEFWQWLSELADVLGNQPLNMPSAEHAYLTGQTVAQYLENRRHA